MRVDAMMGEADGEGEKDIVSLGLRAKVLGLRLWSMGFRAVVRGIMFWVHCAGRGQGGRHEFMV